MAHQLIINGELYHYGKKGMKWGKRKVTFDERMTNYSKISKTGMDAYKQDVEIASKIKDKKKKEQAIQNIEAKYKSTVRYNDKDISKIVGKDMTFDEKMKKYSKISDAGMKMYEQDVKLASKIKDKKKKEQALKNIEAKYKNTITYNDNEIEDAINNPRDTKTKKKTTANDKIKSKASKLVSDIKDSTKASKNSNKKKKK